MAGLDTRGLASGFAQGFGLMNQYQRGQRADERADQQMGMLQERMDMQREKFSAQQEDVQRQRDMENIQFTLGKIGSGMDVAEDELETLRKYPKFWAALDPQTDASINQAMSVIDPNTTVDANDPESLDALNQMFGAEINRGDGGQKRVVGMYPAPDGQSVALELEVVGEDGSTYTAPMTEGRGTADDDLVKYVPVEALVEQVQGMRLLRNTLNSPEAQQRATQVLSLLRGDTQERWEQVQGPGGSILQRNAATGEMKSVIGRAPQQAVGSGSQGAPTATMKEAQWMVEQGIATDIPSAFETLRRSRGDDLQRDRLQLQTINGDLDRVSRRLSNMRPTQDGYAELSGQYESLVQQRDAIAGQVFGTGASTPSQEQESQPPASAPPSASMADDDLLNSILRDL
ncbi:MAG: hypothetical protein JJT87_19110 [Halomonas sp.]|nr:hypothetical protein [Halomonas sp.]MCC5904025.1 hypothetical protein [Halomonas sp.]